MGASGFRRESAWTPAVVQDVVFNTAHRTGLLTIRRAEQGRIVSALNWRAGWAIQIKPLLSRGHAVGAARSEYQGCRQAPAERLWVGGADRARVKFPPDPFGPPALGDCVLGH